jgi:hypothetical protein
MACHKCDRQRILNAIFETTLRELDGTPRLHACEPAMPQGRPPLIYRIDERTRLVEVRMDLETLHEKLRAK